MVGDKKKGDDVCDYVKAKKPEKIEDKRTTITNGPSPGTEDLS